VKRKIGIGLIIILNSLFIYVLIFFAILDFGLIVAEFGIDRGREVANFTTYEILEKLLFFSIIVISLNYFLLRKLIVNNHPFFTSLAITSFGIMVFVPFLIYARSNFLDNQISVTYLSDYLDKKTIKDFYIIQKEDTLHVEKKDQFLNEIGYAKYQQVVWKFQKNTKLLIKHNDGSTEIIFTNGQLFGEYKGKYFRTDKNVISRFTENYLK
jgi:hypothetical protein